MSWRHLLQGVLLVLLATEGTAKSGGHRPTPLLLLLVVVVVVISSGRVRVAVKQT